MTVIRCDLRDISTNHNGQLSFGAVSNKQIVKKKGRKIGYFDIKGLLQ